MATIWVYVPDKNVESEQIDENMVLRSIVENLTGNTTMIGKLEDSKITTVEE